jgi:hypothetical protein
MHEVIFAVINDDDVMRYLDTVIAPRSFADVRRVLGQDPVHAACISAIVFEFCDFQYKQQFVLTKPERNELVEACPFLAELKELHGIGRRKTKIVAGSLAGALRCLRANRDAAMKFFRAAFGNDPFVDDVHCAAAQLLSDSLIRDSFQRSQRGTRRLYGASHYNVDAFGGAFKAVRAYNAYRQGEALSKLQLPHSDNTPVPPAVS